MQELIKNLPYSVNTSNGWRYYKVSDLNSVGIKITGFASLVSYNVPVYDDNVRGDGFREMIDLLIPECLLEVSILKDQIEVPAERKFKTYLMVDERNGYIKIGKSLDPDKRERTLQSEQPKIKLIYVLDSNMESLLHKRFKTKRVRGEWFDLTEAEVERVVMELGFTPKQLR
jgi:hypothetical protein